MKPRGGAAVVGSAEKESGSALPVATVRLVCGAFIFKILVSAYLGAVWLFGVPAGVDVEDFFARGLFGAVVGAYAFAMLAPLILGVSGPQSGRPVRQVDGSVADAGDPGHAPDGRG